MAAIGSQVAQANEDCALFSSFPEKRRMAEWNMERISGKKTVVQWTLHLSSDAGILQSAAFMGPSETRS